MDPITRVVASLPQYLHPPPLYASLRNSWYHPKIARCSNYSDRTLNDGWIWASKRMDMCEDLTLPILFLMHDYSSYDMTHLYRQHFAGTKCERHIIRRDCLFHQTRRTRYVVNDVMNVCCRASIGGSFVSWQ